MSRVKHEKADRRNYRCRNRYTHGAIDVSHARNMRLIFASTSHVRRNCRSSNDAFSWIFQRRIPCPNLRQGVKRRVSAAHGAFPETLVLAVSVMIASSPFVSVPLLMFLMFLMSSQNFPLTSSDPTIGRGIRGRGGGSRTTTNSASFPGSWSTDLFSLREQNARVV